MILLILVPFIFIAAAAVIGVAAVIHVVMVKNTPGKKYDAHEMSCIAFSICVLISVISAMYIF